MKDEPTPVQVALHMHKKRSRPGGRLRFDSLGQVPVDAGRSCRLPHERRFMVGSGVSFHNLRRNGMRLTAEAADQEDDENQAQAIVMTEQIVEVAAHLSPSRH